MTGGDVCWCLISLQVTVDLQDRVKLFLSHAHLWYLFLQLCLFLYNLFVESYLLVFLQNRSASDHWIFDVLVKFIWNIYILTTTETHIGKVYNHL